MPFFTNISHLPLGLCRELVEGLRLMDGIAAPGLHIFCDCAIVIAEGSAL